MRYIPIKVNTMCPAVILAASRKLSVIGRTEILIVSINTRKGFSQLGAPPGSSEAVQVDGFVSMPERRRANQRGRPITSVKER